MQFQADLIKVPVVRPRVTETTALGAAWLAGLAVGFWQSREETAAQWRVDRRFEPMMPRERSEALLATWRRAVDVAKAWATPDTSAAQ
jgi:glycerol kinase